MIVTELHSEVLEALNSRLFLGFCKAGSNANNLVLVQLGVDVNATGDEGFGALHLAAVNDYPEIIDVLLRAGVDVNGRNTKGETPLFATAYFGAPKAARFLLSRGADPTIPDEKGTTPEAAICSCLLESNKDRKCLGDRCATQKDQSFMVAILTGVRLPSVLHTSTMHCPKLKFPSYTMVTTLSVRSMLCIPSSTTRIQYEMNTTLPVREAL